MDEQRKRQLTESGKRLQKLRIAAGLTQTKLALELGIVYQVYQRYERGEAAIPSDRLSVLAELLGVSMDELAPRGKKKSAKHNTFEQILSPEEQELVEGFRRLQDRRTRASLLQILKQLNPSNT